MDGGYGSWRGHGGHRSGELRVVEGHGSQGGTSRGGVTGEHRSGGVTGRRGYGARGFRDSTSGRNVKHAHGSPHRGRHEKLDDERLTVDGRGLDHHRDHPLLVGKRYFRTDALHDAFPDHFRRVSCPLRGGPCPSRGWGVPSGWGTDRGVGPCPSRGWGVPSVWGTDRGVGRVRYEGGVCRRSGGLRGPVVLL